MSNVTGLILVCSLMDGEGPAEDGIGDNIVALNAWLHARGFGPLVDVADYSGGTKHPQCCTFHCGYNYFPAAEFMNCVLAIHWDDPENLVLIMQPEEGATTVYSGGHK
jgi:hypothetical protein